MFASRLPATAALAGPLAALGILLFADMGAPAVRACAAVTVWMAVWWVGEAVPLAVTALLPAILFPLLGVAGSEDIAGSYFNSTVFLFLGGFVLALAMQRWDLHRRIALRIILFFGERPPYIILGFMTAAAVLSMWISNTATAVMMLPMVLAIAVKFEGDASDGRDDSVRITKPLLLGTAYACSVGGVGTLIGTPPNLILLRTHQIVFPDADPLSFARWMLLGVPLAISMLLIIWLVLLAIFRVPFAKHELVRTETVRREYRGLGRLSYEEAAVMIVFTITALLWILRKDISFGDGDQAFVIPGWSGLLPYGDLINDGTVAVAASVLLFLIPARGNNERTRILTNDVFRDLPWGIVLLFGGGFALAHGFESSGLSEYLAGGFAFLDTWPAWAAVLAVSTGMTFLTEFTSNTASTQMLLPVLAQAAVARDLPPLLLMVPAALSASMAFMMPVATPPNAIVFGSERLRIIDMVKAGLVLNLLGALTITGFMLALGLNILGGR